MAAYSFGKNAGKFKKGDWVFADFRLMMVEYELDNQPGRYSITDGLLSTSSCYCFPLTIKASLATMHIAEISRKIHAISNRLLNYPDINNKLIEFWVKMVESKSSNLEKLYIESSDFYYEIKTKCEFVTGQQVRGIDIFR